MITDKLKQDAEPIIYEIYNGDFIQGLIRGDVDRDSVIHYLQADALYLDEFAKIYAMLIAKTGSRETIKYLLGQMEFLFDGERDRKSTRLNSSHVSISYAVFCLKKKINNANYTTYIS